MSCANFKKILLIIIPLLFLSYLSVFTFKDKLDEDTVVRHEISEPYIDYVSSSPIIPTNDSEPILNPPSHEWIKNQMIKVLSKLGYNATDSENPWSCQKPMRHTFFFQKIRTIFTGIPKSGCTHWLEFLLRAEGVLNKTLETAELQTIHSTFVKPSLQNPSIQQALDDALTSSTVFSFVVVRNPWTRMISGYRDKLSEEIRPETENFDFVSRTIAEEMNKLDNVTDPSYERERHPTFNQYLRWLADPSNSRVKPNDHFRPQTKVMCLPSGNYDYIIPLEYSESFSVEVEQRINTTHRVSGSYDKSRDPRASSSTLLAKKWLSQQDQGLIERLYKTFEADFALMNYSNFSHPDFPLPLHG